MPEVYKADQSGEMTRRFIEFVMMQAQNAALFLGQIPNPSTGQPEVNLDAARMFIDQLEMVEHKTRGNLSKDESEILASTLTQLRLAFVRAGREDASSQPPAPEKTVSAPAAGEPAAAPVEETGSKKKFTKSYGA